MRPVLISLLVILGLSGTVRAEALQVFAAASLKTALDQANAAWTAHTNHEAVGVYAATPALAKQISEGAPADVFISADSIWMDKLEQEHLIVPGSRRNLLGNTLVLIAPAGSGIKIDLKGGADLLTPLGGGRMAVGETKAVPAGRYAKAALENLGLWEGIKDHLAEQINVRAAAQLVGRREAPLGIVYGSDVIADRAIETMAVFPEYSHPPIIYPVAVLASSKNTLATDYLSFLQSPEAAEIFIKNGFSVLK